MAIRYINIFSNLGPYKIYPKWDFWFEKKPSGNPGQCVGRKKILEFPFKIFFYFVKPCM
jgi:hypothetical protein